MQCMRQTHTPAEDSPYAWRTGTDYIPTNEEALEIKTIVLRRQEALDMLQANLAAIKAVYDDLLAQRSILVDCIEGHQALLSLPRRGQIPDDILREIFILCLPDKHGAIMHRFEAPLVFTQVCSRWRGVALSTPQLWSNIHIPVPPSTTLISPYEHSTPYYFYRSTASTVKKAELRILAVQDWLSRTSGCPLDITLADSDSEPAVGYAPLLIKTILPFTSRLRSLSIRTTKRRVGQLAQLQPSDVPWLEELDVVALKTVAGEWSAHDERVPDPPATFWRSLPLFGAPKLRQLRLSHLDEDVTELPVDWDVLDSLSLHFNDAPVSMGQIVSLLKRCTQITKFYVSATPSPLSHDDHLPETIEESDEMIILPCLHTLSIRHASPAANPHIFSSFELPALHNLEYFISSRLANPLSELLRIHGKRLRILHVDPLLFAQDGLISCLKQCPNLRELVLRPSPMAGYTHAYPHLQPPGSNQIFEGTDNFLKRLSEPDHQSSYLCPKLDTLAFLFVAKYTDEGIFEFIRRKQAGKAYGLARMRKLVVLFARYKVVDVVEKLGQKEKDDLLLQLQYPRQPEFHNTPLSFTGRSQEEPWAYEGLCSSSSHDAFVYDN